MGKAQRTPTKTPTREEQRQFAADKFRFLQLVALNSELPPLASRFAILLTVKYFNLEYDGIGWASQDTLAEDLGRSRWTVNRLFALLVKHGHLTYKRGGWGGTNDYRMAFPDVGKTSHQEDLERPTDVRKNAHQEAGTEASDVRKNAHPDVRKNAHNLLLPIPGNAQEGVPLGEGAAAAAAASGGGSLTVAPLRRRKKESKGNGAAAAAADPALLGLQVKWDRGHPSDNSKWQLAANAKSWTAAMAGGATPDAILAGAEKWIEAADAPRYLPKLSDWLNTHSWEKEPPSKPKHGRQHANGRGGRKGGLSAAERIFAAARGRMQ